jgi:GNAT superfamily N-acetyltransferase
MTAIQKFPFIEKLTPVYEEQIKRIPFLHLDTFIISTPFIGDSFLKKDYEYSYVWNEEGEILGYFLVYSNPAGKRYHIYKQSSSPFGRGKGIGSAFIETLASELSPDSTIYLYVWEKKIDSISFYESKGFKKNGEIADQKLVFHTMETSAGDILQTLSQHHAVTRDKIDELGKTQHDARKNIKLMLDMVNMLTVNNCNKVIEDITRETTSLINILNSYEDKVERYHELNLKELILERVIPFIEVSQVPCEIKFSLYSRIPNIIANYVEVGRALINIVSNSLEAIQEKGGLGVIEISLKDNQDSVLLEITDNGVGIDGSRLCEGKDGLPLFVGQTTKTKRTGQGIGTKQVFTTFGYENIRIESEPCEFTRWSITLRKQNLNANTFLITLQQRFHEFEHTFERLTINQDSPRTKIAAFIWQCRKTEILAYDLIFQFSIYNNIREIYRNTLLYRYGGKDDNFIQTAIQDARIDYPEIIVWLLRILKTIKANDALITRYARFDDYAGMLFKSYGQAMDNTIIFTLDPETGFFYATDRKLAEHLDFVPYLNKDRENLLRGEFKGDVRNAVNPIYLGVWTVLSEQDLFSKMRMIQQGVKTLIKMGINSEKRLGFYHSTYNKFDLEINPNKITTLKIFSGLNQEEFREYFSQTEEELKGLTFAD